MKQNKTYWKNTRICMERKVCFTDSINFSIKLKKGI